MRPSIITRVAMLSAVRGSLPALGFYAHDLAAARPNELDLKGDVGLHLDPRLLFLARALRAAERKRALGAEGIAIHAERLEPSNVPEQLVFAGLGAEPEDVLEEHGDRGDAGPA